MATTTIRSPSPNPSRPRTPDAAAIARKSCSSSASSMSEHHQRNFGFRSPSPSRRASVEHRENERDSNGCSKSSVARARSPFPGTTHSSSGKGATKSFMAPTISASSKSVAASPRRRILVEKNEAAPSAFVRSSVVTLADESPVPEARSEVGLGTGPHQDAAKVPNDSSDMASVAVEQSMGDVEIKSLRVSGVLSPYRFSPAAPIDSLNVDPSLLPYDPHTNFLSPRPRFLHYRPNPRIEQYLLDESGLTEDMGDGRRLEDSFTSESCEDTQGQVEEEHSTNLQQDCEEVSSSSVVEEVMGGAAGGVAVPKSESDRNSSFKVRSFQWYKFTSLMLAVAIAGSIMTSSLLITPPRMSAMNHLHVVEHYLATSAASLEELGRKFGGLSWNVFDYYAVISTLPGEEFGPIFVANFTASNVERLPNMDYYHMEGMISNEQINQTREDDVYEDEDSGVDLTQTSVNIPQERVMEDEVYLDEKSGIEVTQDSVKISSFERDAEDETMEIQEADVSGDGPQVDTVHQKSEADATGDAQENDVLLEADESGTNKIVKEEGGDIVETEINGLYEAMGSQDGSAVLTSASQTQQSGSEETPLASGDELVPSNSILNELISACGSNGRLVIGFSSSVLFSAALFAFLVKQKKTLSMDKLEVSPAKTKVGISKSVSGSSESHGQARGSPYENNPVDTLLGDSGPSEFSSSFQHSTSVGRQRTTRRDAAEDTLNQERALRTDSEVSSASFSYGSFTTYERRSAKKGSTDEEVVTPVRRSNRIRNKNASP